MLTSDNVERTLRLLDRWGGSTLELMQAVCDYLPLLWEEVQPYYSTLATLPGVFEYEVVSILGERIATHLLNEGKLPTHKAFTRMAREAITTFYLQDQNVADGRPARPRRHPRGRLARLLERLLRGTP